MENRGPNDESFTTQASPAPWASRVYIVDDHRFFTFALTSLVNTQRDLSVCGVAHDETTAADEITHLQPDVVVIDVRLNTQSGFAMAAAVRRFSRHVPILFVSSLQNPAFAQGAKWLEPCSFVEKSGDPSDIIEAIRKTLAKFRLLQNLLSTSNSDPFRETERASLHPGRR